MHNYNKWAKIVNLIINTKTEYMTTKPPEPINTQILSSFQN